MKLRDLLKHFENVDLDTEIYLCSDFDDDGERYLSKNIHIGSELAISDNIVYGDGSKRLIIPDEELNENDGNVVKVMILMWDNMKLYEFLNQFKDLDPNMEVYGYTHSDKVCLEEKKSFHQVVFANDDPKSYPRYKSDCRLENYNREVLVIS